MPDYICTLSFDDKGRQHRISDVPDIDTAVFIMMTAYQEKVGNDLAIIYSYDENDEAVIIVERHEELTTHIRLADEFVD